MNLLRPAILAIGVLMSTSGASAQTPIEFATYTPRINAPKITRAEAPIIDGDLADPAWSKAAIINDFYQVEPREGAPPSQPTRAYIMYDERYLYVAVYNYDSESDNLRRSLLERDAPLQDDDAIRIIIDPFGTFRDGFFFATNPNGARNDALLENNSSFRDSWNTIFDVKTQIVADGWIAEFAIPFQSISFDASLDEWGFQIVRTIRRNNEEIRWSNIDRTRRRVDLTNPGRLAGIEGIDSGMGLEAQLFVSGSASHDWALDDTDYSLDPSGNIFYKITPSLTGSLTFNTDFSDAPLDNRQVNTGRFSLFFPETRDFFLQDAAVFEFGGDVFDDDPNGMPFFSRNIGIVGGRPVDIVAGGKLSGKLGPASVGAITARTGSSGAIDGQVLSAARVSVPVLAESKAGVVFTHGDPEGGTTNTVAGADFQYKNSSNWPGTLTADLAYQRSFDDNVSDDMASGDFSYRGQEWEWTVRAQRIGENYAPRLGFINRPGVHALNGRASRIWRPQDSFIRRVEIGVSADTITDLDFNMEEREVGGWLFAENHAGDRVFARVESGYEVVTEPFNLAGEVPVPIGRYESDTYRVEATLTDARPVGVKLEFKQGRVFGGDTYEIEGRVSIKPNRHLRLVGEYSYSDFSLPGGDIGIHVGALAATIAFSPTMSLKTDIQYDNISENFTYFSRFSWEPRPEREVFLSFGHSAVIEREDFPRTIGSHGSSLAIRLGHVFRM